MRVSFLSSEESLHYALSRSGPAAPADDGRGTRTFAKRSTVCELIKVGTFFVGRLINAQSFDRFAQTSSQQIGGTVRTAP